MNLGNAILQMEDLKLAYRKEEFWDFFNVLNKIPKKFHYSTVTDFARFLGISTSLPSLTEISNAKSCSTTIIA